MKVKLLNHVQLLSTPWTAAHQAPLSMGFSRQEYWSGVPLPSPYFPGKVLISFSRTRFLDIEFLGDRFFSLSPLSMSTHCPLASKVSDEKYGDNLIEDTLCMTTHFSLPAFKILYLCKLN